LDEICLRYGHLTWRQPQICWAISLAELKFRVLQSEQPRVLLDDTAVINSSAPWHATILTPPCGEVLCVCCDKRLAA